LHFNPVIAHHLIQL